MLEYYKLGAFKPLHQILMAGSHDAGITSGAKNTQTQNLDIFLQAYAGIRLFDVRIAATKAKDDMFGDVYEMKSYHGPGKELKNKFGITKVSQNRFAVSAAPVTAPVKQRKMIGGGFGMSLTKILTDAVEFVKMPEHNEFIILKFDHCTNYNLIAQACQEIIGDRLVPVGSSGDYNVNEKSLDELKNRVIVVMEPKGYAEVRDENRRGILKVLNLKSGGGYETKFRGLQYYGKGGTSAVKGGWKGFGRKLKENISKQTKLMDAGTLVQGSDAGSPHVLGMMYWTTTGVDKSIKDRDDFNWSAENQDKLAEFVQRRLPRANNINDASAAQPIKSFMPNFVMIDFADANKCKRIYDMNDMSAVRFQKHLQRVIARWEERQAA